MAFSRTQSAPATAHILLVDDHSLGLAARKVVLEELGHKVTPAASPRQAMELVQGHRFDLVITDFKMPEMSGTELIRWMRQHDVGCPIILISGFVDALGLNLENTGADVVIQKSANEVGQMVRAVKSLLSRPASKKPPSPERPAKGKAKRASS